MKELTQTTHLFADTGSKLACEECSTYASLLRSAMVSPGNDDGPGN